MLSVYPCMYVSWVSFFTSLRIKVYVSVSVNVYIKFYLNYSSQSNIIPGNSVAAVRGSHILQWWGILILHIKIVFLVPMSRTSILCSASSSPIYDVRPLPGRQTDDLQVLSEFPMSDGFYERFLLAEMRSIRGEPCWEKIFDRVYLQEEV